MYFGPTLVAICVIWTGVTNDNTCKVLGKCFIGYIYRNIVQHCTWYNHSIRIPYNTYGHTGTCILSAWFISRGAVFSRSGPHGCADFLAPLSVRCASLSALLKRTATITQAGTGSPTFRSGTVAFNLCLAPLMSRIYFISKCNYRKVSCLGEHSLQGTSPPWVNKQGNYGICL